MADPEFYDLENDPKELKNLYLLKRNSDELRNLKLVNHMHYSKRVQPKARELYKLRRLYEENYLNSHFDENEYLKTSEELQNWGYI